MEHDFKVGDRVVVRDWDDMAAEYDVDFEGDIHIEEEHIYFTKSMEQYCGMEFEVDGVGAYGYISLSGVDDWTFSPSMLLHAESEPEVAVEIDVDAFLGVLGVM